MDCTDEHRLLAYNTEKGFEWITLKDFQLEEREGQVFGNLSAVTETLYGISLTDFEMNNSRFPNEKYEKLKTYFLGFTPFILERGDGKIRNPFVYRDIEAITYLGKRETYDIEVDGKYHNFLANGIVVHNSRAIPFEKMVEVVKNEPFIPLAFQCQHKGMQGNQYITDPYVIEKKKEKWSNAINSAVKLAVDLSNEEISASYYTNDENGVPIHTKDVYFENSSVSKQLCNRLLEPFMWVTQIVTGSREAFENLFRLRCPIYNIEGLKFTSKKEAIELHSHLKDMTDLEWLQCNSGQAEIHFMDLAEKMYDALNESEPTELESGEWHIPFSNEPCFTPEMSLMDKIVLSCAMIARTSYTKIGDSQNISLETARNIFERCKKERHDSIFEHAGRCMTKREWETNLRGKAIYKFSEDYFDGNFVPEDKSKGWNKAFKGFLQLRTFIEEGGTIK